FIAKELVYKYNLTQKEAAKKIGTTQAAISQYKNSKRGVKGVPNYEEIEPIIQNAAAKIAKKMVKTQLSPEEFKKATCELCKLLQKKND
ncbi:MAG: helix-turn-helix domain-containing protein, partial [Crenarchaeota archaeon]|nr:helix-turn-helix domain-containing protein [Thermoproteota archaeon]